MAVEISTFTEGFLQFDEQKAWVTVAKEVFDAVDICRNETRISDNVSPMIGIYCVGYFEEGEIRTIPLFSNDSIPGLVIIIKSEKDVSEMINLIKTHFGDSFWLEEPDYDWPDDAEELFAKFQDVTLSLKDGKLIRG